ncbi:GGDEF domain-containing protein [Miltoncostaea oceani]|uniref:GGDEF domain-containing protein n=1 Tax=Miltoncostaea oceani TaxID=2843216 RepID=UPI001C3C40E2|nr:GGDEF domain-containing protein [Miltoncostaea oceani]
MDALAGERSRRPWFQLEARHSGVLAGRLGAAVVVGVATVAAPAGALARDRWAMAAACVVFVLLHALLWFVPARWPRRLRVAVDVGLVVDALWVTALAAAAGGSRSPVVGLFLVTALWAALGYSARTGVKGGVLASLGFLTLVWTDDGHLWSAASLGRLTLFWGVLVAAVAGAATGERELRLRAVRLGVLHEAALALLAAPTAADMTDVARAAGAELMPGWRVTVVRGPGPGDVRVGREGDEGVVVVPVVVAGAPAGRIECRRRAAGRRTGGGHRVRLLRDVRALETLTASLGSALWRARLVDDAERLSLTDGLTGIANRRAFDVELERRVAEVARNGGSLGLCLLDIDFFKSFNDTFGHQAGDDAIAAVAATLRGTCRAVDVPARYGGEEMAVIMPGADEASALLAAERLRAAIAATPVGDRAVSVSVGVAVTTGGCSPELLIEAADRALYAAKEGGRNRVVAGSVTA